MRHLARLTATGLCSIGMLLIATGCAPRIYSFPAPEFERARLFQAPDVLPPILGVRVEYRVNGRPVPEEAAASRDFIANLLGRNQLTQIVPPAAVSAVTPILKLTIDHTFDEGKARSAGFQSGMTFGAADRDIRDDFSVRISLSDPRKNRRRDVLYDTGQNGVYRHAVVTRIGGSTAGLLPSDYPGAYQRMLESVVAGFLKDLHIAGQESNPIIFVPDTREDP